MKISVIIPVYNVEKYLSKCLDSVMSQTFNDYEVIIINDGSTDGSGKILSKFANKYKNQITVITKKNEGQAIARNIGIKKANGEYIMFVDGDDYIDKNTLKKCYEKAKEKDADIICFGHHMIINGKIHDIDNTKVIEKDIIKDYIIRQTGPCEKLIKKDLIVTNTLFFPKLRAYEDIAVVPTYALFTDKIYTINEGLYYYLIRQGSTMNQITYSEKLEHIFKAMDNLYNIFKQTNKLHLYHNELEYIYIKHLLHGAGLRFIQFDNYKNNLSRITHIMDTLFPKWYKNKYFMKEKYKYKIMCKLLYKQKVNLIKLIKKR